MARLIQRLFDEPLDVIGDVHAEQKAIGRLRTQPDHERPERCAKSRRLIFVDNY